jgi:Membrane-associated sensor domain
MAPEDGTAELPRRMLFPGLIFIILGLLYLTSLYSYLLFHSIAEIFSVVVAFGIFMLAWNSRRFLDNNYLLFIGIAYLFVGMLDILHTLAYKGMGVFAGYDANLPTQLWIAARYMQSFSLLLAPAFVTRPLRSGAVLTAYAAVTALLFAAIFVWSVFPASFIEGSGLTPFKRASEYAISAVLVASFVFLRAKRDAFDPSVMSLLLASIVVTIISELFFTFYISVYGLSNLAGHVLKIIAFYLVYRAIIQTGLVKPYNLLFRQLKQNEEALREERDRLQQYIDTVKVLSGLLPICAACKKIRDDKGYWSQVEIYIERHSGAQFTHGICPDCAQRLYPKLFAEVDAEKLKQEKG